MVHLLLELHTGMVSEIYQFSLPQNINEPKLFIDCQNFFLIIQGEGPDPEEVLLAIRINDSKIAFKSGFEKYLRIDKDDIVRGVSDAVGSMEQWEPVFQASRPSKAYYYISNGN